MRQPGDLPRHAARPAAGTRRLITDLSRRLDGWQFMLIEDGPGGASGNRRSYSDDGTFRRLRGNPPSWVPEGKRAPLADPTDILAVYRVLCHFYSADDLTKLDSLIDASSLGSPEAKAAREEVTRADASYVVGLSRARSARLAAFTELIAHFAHAANCADYMAAGPPDIAQAVRDYAAAHPDPPREYPYR